ncbi:MAG: hypothetical protein LQ351_007964 [Letrouitia transgressa]|nr:MAG: hypothetical protein LQ351_007964 [Letrouitia transgressa]
MPAEEKKDEEELAKNMMDLLIRAIQTVEANDENETIDQRDDLDTEDDLNKDDETVDWRYCENLEEFKSHLCKFLQTGGCISGGFVRDDPYNPMSQAKNADASSNGSREKRAKRRRDADDDNDNDTHVDELEPVPSEKKKAIIPKGQTRTTSKKGNAVAIHNSPKPKKRKQGPEYDPAIRPPPLPFTVYMPALPPGPALPAKQVNGTHDYVAPSSEQQKQTREGRSAGRSQAQVALAADSAPLCNSTSRPGSPTRRLRLTSPRSPKDLAKWQKEKEENTVVTAAANEPAPSSPPKRRSTRLHKPTAKANK